MRSLVLQSFLVLWSASTAACLILPARKLRAQSGFVLDADTLRPVRGALVLGASDQPSSSGSPFNLSHLTFSRRDGGFYIPARGVVARMHCLFGSSPAVENCLVVSKAGYHIYDSCHVPFLVRRLRGHRLTVATEVYGRTHRLLLFPVPANVRPAPQAR